MQTTRFEPVIPSHNSENTSDPWKLALRVGAVYQCPKSPEGKRLGPLVPYAGRTPEGHHLVGDDYFNFAQVEQHPALVDYYGRLLADRIQEEGFSTELQTVIGIPEGGRTLAQSVALHLGGVRYVYPLKIPRPEVPGAVKAESDLVFKRMKLSAGEKVIVSDDVNHRFSNTDDILDAIAEQGAEVVGLCSVLNCSSKINYVYVPQKGAFKDKALPVISLIRRPIMDYSPFDPAVAVDVRAGRVQTEVKKNWANLQKIMDSFGQQSLGI